LAIVLKLELYCILRFIVIFITSQQIAAQCKKQLTKAAKC